MKIDQERFISATQRAFYIDIEFARLKKRMEKLRELRTKANTRSLKIFEEYSKNQRSEGIVVDVKEMIKLHKIAIKQTS